MLIVYNVKGVKEIFVVYIPFISFVIFRFISALFNRQWNRSNSFLKYE